MSVMMTELMKRETSTVRVAKVLETEIASGALPPNSKLKSVRELSLRFGVSVTVILAAMKELERRGLIRRVERKGIFVSECAASPDALEVLIFVFDGNPFGNEFIAKMLSVISAPDALDKMHFHIRTILTEDSKLHSPAYMLRLLRAEIAKLSTSFHFDCALLIGINFLRPHIECCLQLPFPVMFLGNFRKGEEEGLVYNRLGSVQNSFDAALAFAEKQQLKRMIIIQSIVGEQAEFFRRLIRHTRKRAKESGIALELIEEREGNKAPEAVRLKSFARIAGELSVRKHEKTLFCFSNIIRSHKLAEALEARGIVHDPGNIEFLCTSRGGDVQSMFIHRTHQNEETLEAFYEYFCGLIRDLAAGKLNNFRYDYEFQQEVI